DAMANYGNLTRHQIGSIIVGGGGGTLVTNVHLNGGNSSILVDGGASVQIDLDYHIWSDNVGPNWIWQIVIGLDATAKYCAFDYQMWAADTSPGETWQLVVGIETSTTSTGQYCAFDGQPGAYPGVTNTSTFTMTAPATPGVFLFYYAREQAPHCPSAIAAYPAQTRYFLAQVTVSSGGGTRVS